MPHTRHRFLLRAVVLLLPSLGLAAGPPAQSAKPADPREESETYLAPVAVVPVGDQQLAVLGSTGRRLLLLDPASGHLLSTIRLSAEASGMAVRDRTVYVTTNEPAGRLLEIDLDRNRIARTWQVGHTPNSPQISSDGGTVFLANRFEHRVRSVELATGRQACADVIREPVALTLDPRGEYLFVANHLPYVRPFLDDENPTMYAELSVVAARRMEPAGTIALPNGSQGVRGIAVSPGGDYVLVTHVLSNFVIPTLQVAGGAMNRNALSVIRTESRERLATVMLDDPDRGAANPWAVCFTEDGERLVVTHAGTHEISLIDWAALRARAAARSGAAELFDSQSLTALAGIRRRIELPLAGPRSVCTIGGTIYVAGYFSDNLVAVAAAQQPPGVRTIELEPRRTPSLARRGEQYFNDATLCLEHWQSCASCHPDGRADALYWDLLNDGLGNTKNTKSLLMAALTPPVMSRGVRADAGLAVEAGIRHIQFSEPSPRQVAAIEQYLREMPAVPSPALDADSLESPKTEAPSCAKCHYPGVPRGRLTAAAQRGKALFEGRAGCAACHPHPYFTSLQTVDAGLGTGVAYDVPSLVEVWRTAPYLHHGDALSLEDTLTDFNHLQLRGDTRSLSAAELADLLAYLRSL